MTEPVSPDRSVLVMMGVSGCGKSTIGKMLAGRLGWIYQEGDDYHPAANIAKMRAGIPLDDADRQPWLAAIAEWIDARRETHQPGIIGCSALKRRYRDLLRDGRPEVWFVFLEVSHTQLQRRVSTRHAAFMPASLLDSQLATLEKPGPDEQQVLAIDAEGDVATTVDAVMQVLHVKGVIGSEAAGR